MRKLRGVRKYFWRIQRDARSLQLDLSSGSAYAFWHYHVGLVGSPSAHPRPSFRRAFRQALVVAFERVLAQAARCNRPFQTWLFLDEQDFAQDAVFFHMPPEGSQNPPSFEPPANPQTPFPYQPEGVRWDVPLPLELRDLLPPERVRVGMAEFENRRVFFIVPRGVGSPLA